MFDLHFLTDVRKKNVMLLYICVSVVLSQSPARKEREKMISNLDSAELQQLLQVRV